MSSSQGQFLSADLMLEVKHRFHQVDHDHTGKKRLYFDNAGGAFRLKSVLQRLAELYAIQDTLARVQPVALYHPDIQAVDNADFRRPLHATGGSIYTAQPDSTLMFIIVCRS